MNQEFRPQAGDGQPGSQPAPSFRGPVHGQAQPAPSFRGPVHGQTQPMPSPHGQPMPSPHGPVPDHAQQRWRPADPAAVAGAHHDGIGRSIGPTPGLRKLGIAMSILAAVVVATRAITAVLGIAALIAGGAFLTSAEDAGSTLAVIAVGGIVSLLLMLFNIVVSLALFTVSIIAAVLMSGRGRTGAIVVASALAAGVLLSWALSLINMIIGNSVAPGDGTFMTLSIVMAGLEILRMLAVVAALVIGSLMTLRWTRQP